MDPAVAKAIERKLGHVPKRGSSALHELTTLTVSRAYGIDGIECCERLEIFILAGCEIQSVPEVQSLRQLRTFAVADSALENVEGLAGLHVDTVHLERNRVADISPLLDCPDLIDVELAGNPLSLHSYKQVIPELTKRGCRVATPGDREHQLMLMLNEQNLPFSYYKSRDGYRLCRPGLSFTGSPEVNHPVVEPDELERMLRTDPALVVGMFSTTDS
ncbi:leucine-rich repeat domain-containing protein [Streptomyces griseus]|uniref:hypothetical protein n=1 Tax=Streptomyces griseus TaxID=1911 RepID=UPI003667DB3B